jgi:gamma-glutamyl-gamma-aminobutyrate hydrolase PuuD
VAAWHNPGMRVPLIGLTSYAEEARWAVWEGKAAVVGWVYVDAIHRAGGRTLLIPPSDHGVEETLNAIDGLVLAGGNDIDPAAYGALPHAETQEPQPERDRAELALLSGALARDLPLLAICRGMQVLNVARGGDLVQHLPDTAASTGHREVVGQFSEHPVEIAPNSLLERILGPRAPVKSHHHQAAAHVGDGLAPVAWSEDGTIEALEDPGRSFALGVQWHPEESADLALFEALVGAARNFRAGDG